MPDCLVYAFHRSYSLRRDEIDRANVIDGESGWCVPSLVRCAANLTLPRLSVRIVSHSCKMDDSKGGGVRGAKKWGGRRAAPSRAMGCRSV